MNWLFGSSTSKSSGPSESDRRSSRSGSFSPKDVKSKIDTIHGLFEQDDESVSYTVTKKIKIKSDEENKYVQVNLQDFLDPQNASFRPKKLKISIKNTTPEHSPTTRIAWIPVPLIKHRHYDAKEFKNGDTFNEEIVLDITPKMTFYQVNERNHPVQADFTFINVFNMYKDVPFTISLGSMYIIPERTSPSDDRCIYEVEYTLSGLLTPY